MSEHDDVELLSEPATKAQVATIIPILDDKIRMIGDAIVQLAKIVGTVNKNVESLKIQVETLATTTTTTRCAALDLGVGVGEVLDKLDDLSAANDRLADKLELIDGDVKNIKIYKYVKP